MRTSGLKRLWNLQRLSPLNPTPRRLAANRLIVGLLKSGTYGLHQIAEAPPSTTDLRPPEVVATGVARFKIAGGREIGWNKRWGSMFSIPKKTLVDIWSENNDLLAVLVVVAGAPSSCMRNKTRNRGAASISKGKIAGSW